MAKYDTLANEQESRQVAEAAREEEWEKRSFARRLFEGHFDPALLYPLPEASPDERRRAEAWLEKLEAFSLEHIDGDRFDREGHVPQSVIDGLAELGAFGIKIPQEYGGLGFHQVTYNRALCIVSSRCGSTGAFLSAHQSIGVPGPLLLFGTDAQKEAYLPRLAAGELSAFALTEADVGSDPANMSTTAELSEDGEHWILDGEKLWCTNGPRADIIVVMARTPDRSGRGRRPISAFIVETSWDGVSVVHESQFMGLRAISNGVLRFEGVKVPRENLLWQEGKGLKLALVTLNTGRLSLPAFCSAAGKASLEISRKWGAERVQWGQPIGKHDAIAQMLGGMAADAFAMDAVTEVTSQMADAGTFDIRLEAAIAKMWNTEKAFDVANDALQIRGGRGYETHDSLKTRGERPYPVERMVRDLRINLIFEGSSEIMRLFIAREAVDMHLKVGGDMIDPRASLGTRLAGLVRAGLHYAWWYPSRFLGWSMWPRYSGWGPFAGHMRWMDRTARRLSRSIFTAMVRFGPSLEKKQAVLGRIVEIGAELFVMTAACIHARQLVEASPGDVSATTLADLFCRRARRRIQARFDALFDNDDAVTYTVAREAMDGRFGWLEGAWMVPLDDIYGVRPMMSSATGKEVGEEPAGVEEPAPGRVTASPSS
ncbi:MAG: acyl-CoA dehydrogenase family protein [Gemmatimonadota bacterium]|jgi:alkylation response protein AidB-like acyl-CoA dehydrogenase